MSHFDAALVSLHSVVSTGALALFWVFPSIFQYGMLTQWVLAGAVMFSRMRQLIAFIATFMRRRRDRFDSDMGTGKRKPWLTNPLSYIVASIFCVDSLLIRKTWDLEESFVLRHELRFTHTVFEALPIAMWGTFHFISQLVSVYNGGVAESIVFNYSDLGLLAAVALSFALIAWTASVVHHGEDANGFTVTYGEFMFALVDLVGRFLAISLLVASVGNMGLQMVHFGAVVVYLVLTRMISLGFHASHRAHSSTVGLGEADLSLSYLVFCVCDLGRKQAGNVVALLELAAVSAYIQFGPWRAADVSLFGSGAVLYFFVVGVFLHVMKFALQYRNGAGHVKYSPPHGTKMHSEFIIEMQHPHHHGQQQTMRTGSRMMSTFRHSPPPPSESSTEVTKAAPGSPVLAAKLPPPPPLDAAAAANDVRIDIRDAKDVRKHSLSDGSDFDLHSMSREHEHAFREETMQYAPLSYHNDADADGSGRRDGSRQHRAPPSFSRSVSRGRYVPTPYAQTDGRVATRVRSFSQGPRGGEHRAESALYDRNAHSEHDSDEYTAQGMALRANVKPAHRMMAAMGAELSKRGRKPIKSIESSSDWSLPSASHRRENFDQEVGCGVPMSPMILDSEIPHRSRSASRHRHPMTPTTKSQLSMAEKQISQNMTPSQNAVARVEAEAAANAQQQLQHGAADANGAEAADGNANAHQKGSSSRSSRSTSKSRRKSRRKSKSRSRRHKSKSKGKKKSSRKSIGGADANTAAALVAAYMSDSDYESDRSGYLNANADRHARPPSRPSSRLSQAMQHIRRISSGVGKAAPIYDQVAMSDSEEEERRRSNSGAGGSNSNTLSRPRPSALEIARRFEEQNAAAANSAAQPHPQSPPSLTSTMSRSRRSTRRLPVRPPAAAKPAHLTDKRRRAFSMSPEKEVKSAAGTSSTAARARSQSVSDRHGTKSAAKGAKRRGGVSRATTSAAATPQKRMPIPSRLLTDSSSENEIVGTGARQIFENAKNLVSDLCVEGEANKPLLVQTLEGLIYMVEDLASCVNDAFPFQIDSSDPATQEHILAFDKSRAILFSLGFRSIGRFYQISPLARAKCAPALNDVIDHMRRVRSDVAL